jgi:ubiquinone/menaquinone biosynthesis C-methylase UbiE
MTDLRWNRKTDYEGENYSRYAEARNLLPETERVWMDRVLAYAKGRTGIKVVDVGSGTGRFALLLANALEAEVVGVEPSDQMLRAAVAANTMPKVQYLKGSAESLPLVDKSFDLAWLSMVIHHVIDRNLCAEELARVLRPGGVVLIRNTFQDGLTDSYGIPFYGFFPGALEVDRARLPSVAEVTAAFEGKGFVKSGLERVNQVLERSLKAYLSRLRKGGISTLEHLSKAQREEGFRRLAIAAENEVGETPVLETIDLLVFTKR